MVQWTGEKDAILLTGIFDFIDIKFSKELLEHLANKIGDGCTPKAVHHRLANMKAKGKAANTAAGLTPTTPNKSSATTTAKPTPKSTGTGKGRGRGKKAQALENMDSGGAEPMDDAEDLEKLFTPSKKRSRPKKEDVNSEKVGNGKKIKVEEGVEEDGIRGEMETASFDYMLGGGVGVADMSMGMGMDMGGDMHDEGYGHEDEI